MKSSSSCFMFNKFVLIAFNTSRSTRTNAVHVWTVPRQHVAIEYYEYDHDDHLDQLIEFLLRGKLEAIEFLWTCSSRALAASQRQIMLFLIYYIV